MPGTVNDNQTEVRNMVGYVPSTKTFTVGNEPGAELPSTGGSGTRWIYILGAALTLFAAGLLWKKKPQ